MLSSVALKKPLLLLCFSALFPLATLAETNGQGGMIHFSGRIVESPCEVAHVQQRIAMSCDNDGHSQTRYYSAQMLPQASQHFKQIATVNMRYLDKQKKLAILEVNYR
ncbi:type 1 fimbrial protein [Citrobacter amalonaticus]|uniref:type 1 fimbrial protein n=1 Tax=Citrobacter amalonaticus TaxID=35703 RepID=UPI00300D91E3